MVDRRSTGGAVEDLRIHARAESSGWGGARMQ